LWSVDVVGAGPAVSEVNGRLEVLLPRTAVGGAGGVIRAGYASRCQLRGDFDVQVSYTLIAWPDGNGTRLALTTGWSMERTSFGGAKDYPGRPREAYMVETTGSGKNITATTHRSGALRLARVGNTMYAYRLEGSSWVLQYSGKAPSGDLAFSIAAWSEDALFTDRDVLAAFDDFIVLSGTVVCP
jgi:hypothetical protein